MNKKNVITKILAVTGSILVWLPILAPCVFAVLRLVAGGRFLFDFLMPAELFPTVLAGGALLLWAALRARAHQKLIGWGLAIAVIALAGEMGLAVVTGLASGAIEPAGWPWALVIASLVLYTLAVVAMGVGGVLLLRHLFKRPTQ